MTSYKTPTKLKRQFRTSLVKEVVGAMLNVEDPVVSLNQITVKDNIDWVDVAAADVDTTRHANSRKDNA